ncbi:MAG: hypothetical protein P8J32_05195 [bacterium]|jgi:hypothetical protein|nr:hypothetical protein [bacterium]
MKLIPMVERMGGPAPIHVRVFVTDDNQNVGVVLQNSKGEPVAAMCFGTPRDYALRSFETWLSQQHFDVTSSRCGGFKCGGVNRAYAAFDQTYNLMMTARQGRAPAQELGDSELREMPHPDTFVPDEFLVLEVVALAS